VKREVAIYAGIICALTLLIVAGFLIADWYWKVESDYAKTRHPELKTVLTNAVAKLIGFQRIVDYHTEPTQMTDPGGSTRYLVTVDFVNALGGISRTNVVCLLFTAGGRVNPDKLLGVILP
jgi:hypothetical protein